MLIKFGISELAAVRTTSTFYGFFSLLFLMLCYLALIQFFDSKTNLERLQLNLFQRGALLLFAFLPSNFLWSTLGLRESGSQLFLLSFTYFAIKILGTPKGRNYAYTLPAALSLALSFGARRETAFVFTFVTFLFSLALAWKIKNGLITAALFIGFVFGQIFTTTPMVEAKEVFVAIKLTKLESKSPVPTQSGESKSPVPTQSGESKSPDPTQSGESKSPVPATTITSSQVTSKCKNDEELIVIEDDEFRCVLQKDYVVQERNPIESVSSQILTAKNLEYKRNVNRIDAQSALPESECQNNLPRAINILTCNFVELPNRLPTFLFRPFPFVESGSNFFKLAGSENLIWLILILTNLYMLIRSVRLKVNRFFLSWLFSYWIVFSVAASLYEGNLGTAFRHKSTILWAITLVLLFSFKNSYLHGREVEATQR
jgi:hypothetical protein